MWGVGCSASNEGYPKVRNHEEGPTIRNHRLPTMAFSWLKAAMNAFTFKTLFNPNSEGVPATHLSEGGG